MDQPSKGATAESVKRPDRGKPGRAFGLLDAIILVGAAAAGATSIRPVLHYGRGMPNFFREYFPALGPLFFAAYSDLVVEFLVPWLASLTLAFLAIRLRKPRPRFRRLMQQPGTVACVAAAFVMAIGVASASAAIGVVGLNASENLEDFCLPVLSRIFNMASIAVVAVWSFIALAGRWKPEAGWIDLMGRVVGATWILIFIISSFFSHLFYAANAKYAPRPMSPAQAAIQEKLLDDEIKAEEQRTKDLERELEKLKQEEKGASKEVRKGVPVGVTSQ